MPCHKRKHSDPRCNTHCRCRFPLHVFGCGDKQREYIGKWKDGKTLADYDAQKTRLTKMLKSKLTPEATDWLKLRLKILKDLVKRLDAAPASEL